MSLDSDMFRRDANIQPGPGAIIAEFSNGTQALKFANENGYSVTAGINLPFACRVPHLESVAAGSSADSTRAAATDPQTARGFRLTALTAKGRARLPAIESLLALLPHCGDSL